MNAADIRARILDAADLKREAVEVPEWGVTIYVRQMTARERDAFESEQVELAASDGTRNVSARIVAFCAVDADGNRIFGDGDADLLGNRGAAPVRRLANVAFALNKLSGADVEAEVGKSDASDSDGGSTS